MTIEQLHFEYKAEREVYKKGHVGIVASGDLEIMVEPSPNKGAQIYIRTHTDGFEVIWRAILDRFMESYPIAAIIRINDCGATPGVVNLRLAQATEVMEL
ncbi:MAG: malonate decarboxylase acyl carrier protein [Paenibacillaceae bacterium]